MYVGVRVQKLRKHLGLSQKDFGECLGISQKHISQIEKDTREPSEQLIKHLCLRYNTSESWIKTGEGEMFTSPEESLKNIKTRLGERVFMDAINNIMKENGLAFAAGRAAHRADTGDPELDRMINILHDLWDAGEDLKGWTKVQFNRSFPDEVVEDVQKKQQETKGQAQIS
ncbi:transcriptional regulator, XRE family [Desulfofarcimen acetoxidans DSM 771]|uniref:Transcriptional regulator, XRE family n=1 Tax=Desulfofarcimen acetoxidans (strain ATCC 49208 / DSM 771 / KCTC 5769 / VKM B-1644 / 5575) TaxID=485916 RepID=C8VZC8_DESAS|nr:helix-turn-helix transcriptional regulator [Desulfofarcimen acetoxidans]ACV64873.1 transcriptional regulator, XRE family [Desulfofarcimen acetoxidans DSM 771]